MPYEYGVQHGIKKTKVQNIGIDSLKCKCWLSNPLVDFLNNEAYK